VPQNLVSAATDCSGSNRPLQAFHDPTNSYFTDYSLKQADDSVTRQPACERVPFAVSSLTPFTACRPNHSDSSSYVVPSANSFNGVKSDPDGPADWHCSTRTTVWHQPNCSATSPGQPVAGAPACSSGTYQSTMPYTSVPVEWSAAREQKPMRITPSMSIGEPKLLCDMMIVMMIV